MPTHIHDKIFRNLKRVFLYMLFSYKKISKKLLPSKKHKYIMSGIFSVVVLIGIVALLEPAKAAGFTTETIMNGIITGLSFILLKVGELFIAITVFFLEFFIEIASYNGFSTAPPVIIGWFMIRDLANMFFVIMLLVIAFGTILGLEQYEWKKTLVKLILAAIFINFSKLIAQVIIDAAHVFTITFLNAIAATAGGNLISMFNLDDLLKILPDGSENPASLRLDIFAASVMVAIFGILTMFIMGAYLLILLIRMVVLWVLIILSPLAYIMSVLPQTKSYAQEYWSTFINHVIVAPMIVFFLWLSFAAFGSGNIASQIGIDPSDFGSSATQALQTDFVGDVKGLPQGGIGDSISLSKATSWENMASFMIALAFLLVGIERVQKLGVKGGGLTQSALSFGKNVAGIATGYAAGRWVVGGAARLAGKGVGLAGKGIKGAAWYAPVVGGENISRIFQTEGRAFQSSYYASANKDKKDLKGIEKVLAPFARRRVSSIKRLKKTENTAEWEEKLAFKASGSEAGGRIFYKGETDDDGKKLPWDRVLQGRYEAEDARSEAKNKEWKAYGAYRTLNSPRIKDGESDEKRGTVAEQIAAHELKTEAYEGLKKEITKKARQGEIEKGEKFVQERISKVQEIDKNLEEARSEEEKETEIKISDKKKKIELKVEDINANAKVLVEAVEGKFSSNISEKRDQSKKANLDLGQLKLELKEIPKGDTKERESKKAEIANQSILAKAADSALKDTESEQNKGIEEINKQKVRDIITARDEDSDLNSLEEKLKGQKEAREGSDEYKELAAAATAQKQDILKEIEPDLQKIGAELHLDNFGSQGAAAAASFFQKQKTLTSEKELESKEEGFDALLAETDNVQGLFDRVHAAEAGSEAAKNFIKGVKDGKLSKSFREAGVEIANAITKGSAELDKVAKENVFAWALKEDQVAQERAEDLDYTKKTGESAAAAGYVELKNYGISTPSEALVALSKRLGDALNKLDEGGRASAAVNNFAKIASQIKEGKELTSHQKAFAYGVLDNLTANANIDDAFGEITKRFNRLIDSPESFSKEDRESTKNLREVFVDQLGIIKQENGRYVGINNAENVGTLQHYVLSGGNTDLVKQHKLVEAEKDRTGKSYAEAAKDVLSAPDLTKFKAALGEIETLLNDSAEGFKKHALAAGHAQNGGHQRFDSEFGMLRFSTAKESDEIMQSSIRKRKGAHAYNYQSFGDLDTTSGALIKLNAQKIQDAFGSITKVIEISKVLDRTRDGLLGYQPSEEAQFDEDRNGLLGGKASSIVKKFGSMEKYIKNVLVPLLSGSPQAVSLLAHKKFAGTSTSTEADKGILRVAVDGTGIKGTNTEELINSVKAEISASAKGYSAEEKKKLLEDLDKALLQTEKKFKAGADKETTKASADKETTAEEMESEDDYITEDT